MSSRAPILIVALALPLAPLPSRRGVHPRAQRILSPRVRNLAVLGPRRPAEQNLMTVRMVTTRSLPECGQAADPPLTLRSFAFNNLGAAVLWHAVCTKDRRQIG